jgi:hypothetical protein
MAVTVKLDFNNSYHLDSVTEDLRMSVFRTELQDGTEIPLKVEINKEPHELLPDVF